MVEGARRPVVHRSDTNRRTGSLPAGAVRGWLFTAEPGRYGGRPVPAMRPPRILARGLLVRTRHGRKASLNHRVDLPSVHEWITDNTVTVGS
jgi:hypothetical protein